MVMSILLILVIVAAALGAGLYMLAPHPPRTPNQVQDLTGLEVYLDRLVASQNPPGLSLAVVKDGQIVYKRAFGYEDRLNWKKANPDTVYHWWSMTKIPTMIAIMQLVEQGKLVLDGRVAELLPWFEVSYPSATSPAITVRHLLQHSSGLPDTMPAMIGWVHYDDATRDQTELTRRPLAMFNRLKFEPGAKAVYSNLNYMLLGAIIEAVTGLCYEVYISNFILHPLGMLETNFVVTSSMAEHEASGSLPLVHPYTPLLPTLLDMKALIRQRQGKLFWLKRVYIDATPSTGLIGPAAEAARLLLAYLNGGELEGVRILQPETVDMLNQVAPVDGHGLGWFMGESNGRPYLGHAGGGAGFATDMRLFPDQRLGIVILANGTDLDRDGLQKLLSGMSW
jgi:CubicO group peptidase (beta-lactamase class C family)